MEKLGFIGLGNMGFPIAQNLLKAGNPVFAYDVVKEKRDALREFGAEICISSAEVAQNADVIFTSVPDGNILKIVVCGKGGILEGLRPGTLMVDLSTIAPAESEEICAILEEKGASLLRSPVTGSTILAECASIGVLASGAMEDFERAMPYYKAISNKQFYMGDGEQARAMKLAINLMIGMNMQMLAEAMLLATKAGIEWKQAIAVISESAVGSPVIKYKVPPVSERDYAPAFSIKMMIKDFNLAFDAASRYGVPIPTSALTRQMLVAAAASGHGGDDISVLVEVMQEIFR